MSLKQVEAIVARFSQMKAGWDGNVTLDRMRSDIDDLAASFKPVAPFSIESVSVAGVDAEWVFAEGADASCVILYFHGGGFATGSIRGTRNLAAQLSAASGARVLVLGYRLAPENPFPAAIEDAQAAYGWLLKQGFVTERIALAGDSAGGGLALALLGQLSAQSSPFPACAVLLTPWVDLRCEAASYNTHQARDPVASREMAQMMAATYLGAAGKTDDPRATTVLADFKNYPPLLIQVADRDVFIDDGRAVRERAQAAGVAVDFEEWPGMIHQWQQYASVLDEGREALKKIGDFIRRHQA